MRYLECLSSLDIARLYYCRYVNDIFCIVQSLEIDNIIITLVGNSPIDLKLTALLISLTFLSLLSVIFLITNWFSDVSYISSPISQKRAMFFYFVNRAISLTNSKFHSWNLKNYHNILIGYSYPPSFIVINTSNRKKP